MAQLKNIQNQSKSGHGGPRPNSGRKVGSKNVKTMQWTEFGEKLIDGNLERVQKYLDNLPDPQFFSLWLQLLEYFKPKQSRTEVQSLDKNGMPADPVKIEIIKTLRNGDSN